MGVVWFSLSVLANIILLYCLVKWNKNNEYYYVLLIFALFPFSGRWLYPITHNYNNVYFSYFEIIFSCIILYRYRFDKNTPIILLFLPLSTLPALINIDDFEGYSTYFFYFFLLIGGIGYYKLFREKMKEIIENNVVDKVLIVWTILAFVYKVISALEVDTWFLLSRAGSSLLAGNHQAMIILLLIPFARRRWVAALSIGFTLLHFSRGVYLSLLLYLFLYFIFISPLKAIKMVRFSAAIFLMIFIIVRFQFPNIYNFAEDALFSRLIMGGTQVTAPMASQNFVLSFNDILNAFYGDDRNNIQQDALDVAEKTNYIGIGLGRFLEGTKLIGSPRKYSNAHNLYLTLLSEGGILFLLLFVYLLVASIKKAYIFDKRIFVSLIVFAFYGLFSGQIYESTAERSCVDYFYLIFLLAFLEYQAKLRFNLAQ